MGHFKLLCMRRGKNATSESDKQAAGWGWHQRISLRGCSYVTPAPSLPGLDAPVSPRGRWQQPLPGQATAPHGPHRLRAPVRSRLPRRLPGTRPRRASPCGVRRDPSRCSPAGPDPPLRARTRTRAAAPLPRALPAPPLSAHLLAGSAAHPRCGPGGCTPPVPAPSRRSSPPV